mmetsp:Transcript_7798/g.12934  ORF Transcript_7798/g.12934 Transcript_7798/m.12934 type:complete len:262 (+) Transcript_7798:587-1372(+)
MHVFRCHDPLLEGRAQLPHETALAGEVRDELGSLHHRRGDFVLRGLVRARRDDCGMRLQPVQLKHLGAGGCLGEYDVSIAHRLLRRAHHLHRVAALGRDVVAEPLRLLLVQSKGNALLKAVHLSSTLGHGGGNGARADIRYCLVLGPTEVLDRHSPSSTCAQICEVSVLLEDSQWSAVGGIANHENPRTRRQTLLEVFVEANIGKFHRPSCCTFNVSSFNVTVTGSCFVGFVDTDVHRNWHIYLPFRQHAKCSFNRFNTFL